MALGDLEEGGNSSQLREKYLEPRLTTTKTSFGSVSFLEEKSLFSPFTGQAVRINKGIRTEWQDSGSSEGEAQSASWPRIFQNKAKCPTSSGLRAQSKLFTTHWPDGGFLIQLMLEAAVLGSCAAFKE